MRVSLSIGLLLTSLLGGVVGDAAPCLADVRRLGPEVQVNDNVDGFQGFGGAVPLVGGGYLVAYSSTIPLNHDVAMGRRLDHDGTPIGDHFLLAPEFEPDFLHQVSILPATLSGESGIVVVWDNGNSDDGEGSNAHGRLLDSRGNPVGSPFQLNDFTPNYEGFVRVAALEDGFVATWWDGGPQDVGDDGFQNVYAIYARLFDAGGAAKGPQFEVTLGPEGLPLAPAVAGWPADRFLVVWFELDLDASDDAIAGRLYDADGTPAGEPFVVNTTEAGPQRYPRAATLSDGRFVVVWEGFGPDPEGAGITGQILDSNGTKVGPEFQVNSLTAGHQTIPKVAAAPDGGFLVVWIGPAPDGDGQRVYARPFRADGSPHGEDFQVSIVTKGGQLPGGVPAAFGDDGTFVLGWTDRGGRDTFNEGVFAQRFAWLPDLGPLCGDVGPRDLALTATDALTLLRSSVGLLACSMCACGPDVEASVTARHALTVLRASVSATEVSDCQCPPA